MVSKTRLRAYKHGIHPVCILALRSGVSMLPPNVKRPSAGPLPNPDGEMEADIVALEREIGYCPLSGRTSRRNSSRPTVGPVHVCRLLLLYPLLNELSPYATLVRLLGRATGVLDLEVSTVPLHHSSGSLPSLKASVCTMVVSRAQYTSQGVRTVAAHVITAGRVGGGLEI